MYYKSIYLIPFFGYGLELPLFEKSGTKTDAASERRAGLHAMASGEEETEGKLLS